MNARYITGREEALAAIRAEIQLTGRADSVDITDSEGREIHAKVFEVDDTPGGVTLFGKAHGGCEFTYHLDDITNLAVFA